MYGLYQYYLKKRRSARQQQRQRQGQQQQQRQMEMEMLQMQVQRSGPLQRPARQVNWREAGLQRRKVADCQIILCLVTTGLVIIITGSGMLIGALFMLGREDPFMLIGPVLACCGLLVLLLSIEVCVRRRKVVRLADDLSSDEEDGHYMDETLIPYAFGHFAEQSVPVVSGPSSSREVKPAGSLCMEPLPPIEKNKRTPSRHQEEALQLKSLSSDDC